MALTSLSVKVELDEANGSFIITDLIGNDYNTLYGYVLTDVKGLLKISGFQGSIIYKNSGWDSDNYSSPDITSLSWSKTISSTVPLGQDGLIVKGFYTIEYKVSVEAVAATFLTFLQVFNNIYERPDIKISSFVSLTKSTFTFTDDTSYTIISKDSYSPTSLTRNFDITWPLSSGIPNTVSSDISVQLGPDIWSGYYLCSFTADVSYLLVNNVSGLTVTVSDSIKEVLHRIAVVYDDFAGLVNQALIQLTASYEKYKLYNLPYAENYQDILDDIMMYYDMVNMGKISGTDMSLAMTKIYDILTDEAYNLSVGIVIEEKEIFPWRPAVTGDVGVPGGVIFFGV